LKLFYKLSLLALLCPTLSYAQTKADTVHEVSGPVFFVGAGVNSSIFRYVGENQLNSAKAPNSVNAQINTGANIFLNQSQDFFFRLQLGFSFNNKANFTASYQNPNGFATNTYNLKFTQNSVSLTPQFIYNVYNGNTWKAFIDVGFCISHATYSNKEYNFTVNSPSGDAPTTIQQQFPAMHPLQYNVPLKIGVSVKHIFDIYADYVPKTSLNQEIGYAVYLSQYQFGIDYFLGGK
jgi:hypothetical protein